MAVKTKLGIERKVAAELEKERPEVAIECIDVIVVHHRGGTHNPWIRLAGLRTAPALCGIRGSFPGPCRQKEFLRPSETGAGVVSSHRLCAVPCGTAPAVSDAPLQISPALPQTRASSVSSGPKRATDSRDDDGKIQRSRSRTVVAARRC